MTVNAALAARTPGLEKYVGKLCYRVLHVTAQFVHSGRQLHPRRDGKPTQADAANQSKYDANYRQAETVSARDQTPPLTTSC